MELRQLELFVAVAEELHFGRAARRVHLSQPAFTTAIAKLERELGARLLERTSRRVALTPAGEALHGRAASLLAQAQSAADLVARTAHGELGSVRVGVVGTAMLDVLPALVRAVGAAHPGVGLVLSEQTGASQAADLLAGRLDLGILHAGPQVPAPGLELTPLREEPLAVALPAAHRLAHRSVLRLAELADDPFVVLRAEPTADTHALYLRACAEAGFAPRIAQDVTSLQALLGFVAAGLGWAFVAQAVVEHLQRSDVRYVALRGVAQRLPTALAAAPGPLPASAALVREVALGLAAR